MQWENNKTTFNCNILLLKNHIRAKNFNFYVCLNIFNYKNKQTRLLL